MHSFHPPLDKGRQDFLDFASILLERTKTVFPACTSIWAKWNSEDLIPFLSDFDSRMVCNAPVSIEEWIEFDRVIGDLHAKLCRERCDWARILEHTPGVCTAWDEMLDPDFFHPETEQWSFYFGNGERRAELEAFQHTQQWGTRHEFYFLGRLLHYLGPYRRGIDPPINLGAWEYKYAMHSRLWHYFVPALQAALSLVKRRTIRGKFEALHGWQEVFPEDALLNRVTYMVERHYEVKELGDSAALGRLEDELCSFLERLGPILQPYVTLVDLNDAVRAKTALSAIDPDPLLTLYDVVRFSRVRRGRYYVYLNSPECFHSEILIEREVKLLKDFFTTRVLKAYSQFRLGTFDMSLNVMLEDLGDGSITPEEKKAIRQTFDLALQCRLGGERETLRQALDLYPAYYSALESILHHVKREATILGAPFGSRAELRG
jgi:hypothetical protein